MVEVGDRASSEATMKEEFLALIHPLEGLVANRLEKVKLEQADLMEKVKLESDKDEHCCQHSERLMNLSLSLTGHAFA
jgi:hypothetical protein